MTTREDVAEVLSRALFNDVFKCRSFDLSANPEVVGPFAVAKHTLVTFCIPPLFFFCFFQMQAEGPFAVAKPDRIVQEFVDALGNSNCDYELGATWPDADELECTDKDRDKSEQETLSSPHFPPKGSSSKGSSSEV